MARKKSALEKRGQQLVDNLCEAAKYHGWQQDQGIGNEVQKAEVHYNQAKLELEQYISNLHSKIRRQSSKINSLEADRGF